MVIRFFLRASGFNFSRRGAKMPLDFSFFLLRGFFSENILVFCVRLRKVIEAEPLRELQLAAALRVALNHHVNAPFDFRGRALPAASEILVVLHLELPNIFFECSQLFFDGGHERRIPSNLHARCAEQNRQPDARAAVRIRYGALRRDSNEVPRAARTPDRLRLGAGREKSNAALLHASWCAEMFGRRGGLEGKAGFEWKRAGRKRFRRSKENSCGRFRRWTNCWPRSGWRRFRNVWTATWSSKLRARCLRICARESRKI